MEKEQAALKFNREGKRREAAKLFREIVDEEPGWEHGMSCYSLACCYEDLGELQLAEKYYINALKFDPRNSYFLGGIASFYYLHGDPKKALSFALTLLQIEKAVGNEESLARINVLIKSLQDKIDQS